MKKIYDPLYGFIYVTPLMLQFIDTTPFQMLRDKKQLGATCYVFPSATHTRFEHSLGVSHLAYVMMTHLRKEQPELHITDRMIELTQIAGLLHDIGHGPFSHLYDHYVKSYNQPDHEGRGIIIIEKICHENEITLEYEERKEIYQMISPDEDHKNNWKYQIVANAMNSIDVDKMDYIRRDCYHIGLEFGGDYKRIIEESRVVFDENKNQIIAWHEKTNFDLFSLFHARFRLHKQILYHHAVKSYEYEIIGILRSLERSELLDIESATDSVVTCRMFKKNKLNFRRSRMDNREIAKHIKEVEVSSEISKYLNCMLNDAYVIDEMNIQLKIQQNMFTFITNK
jgi:deoxynucleoside triphosphate triphosphohydrolase SAMHD1